MDRRLLGAGFVAFAAILWGFDGVVLTPRLFSLNVPFVVFLLHLLPFFFMVLFLHREFAAMKRFSRADLFTFLAVALFGGALGTLSIVKALFLVHFNQLSVVIMIQKLQPIFAIGLAAILLRERLRGRYFLWASVAVIATYFLAFGLRTPTVDASLEAVSYALLAAFSFGAATVLGRKVVMTYSFRTVTFYRYFFTTIIMTLYLAILGQGFPFSSITGSQWLIFAIIGLTTGSGALFLYYYGLQRIRASIATIAELFFPASAIVFDYLVNGSVLSLVQWVAALVLLYAITQVTIHQKEDNGQERKKAGRTT
ncbi:MAG: DMT family transporter [DPANN group archaeon]|nr:DMT family transporter [DPANN group archaeon]